MEDFQTYYNNHMTAVYANMAAIKQLTEYQGSAQKRVGKASLAAKKAWVMANLDTIPKNGVYSGGGKSYNYATDEDVLGTMRPLLAEAGLALQVEMKEAQNVDLTSDKKGAEGTVYTTGTKVVRVAYGITLSCSHTGYQEYSQWVADVNIALGDKALNAVSIHALKYWLKNTFAAATGEDPDSETGYNDKSHYGQKPPHQKPAAKPEPPSKPTEERELVVISPEQLLQLKQSLADGQFTDQRALAYVNAKLTSKGLPNITDLSQTPVTVLDSLLSKVKK